MMRDALVAYLICSVPFGLLLTRFAGLGDIRDIGSGNIGATNVLRTGRKGLAALTLALDGLKGVAAVLIAGRAPVISAMFAVVGHMFPIWLGFRGGKGVATGLGVLLALAFPVGMLACATWIGMALWKRYSSAAALSAFGVSPLVAMIFGEPWSTTACTTVIAALVVYKHRCNIKRLCCGEEPHINFGAL